MPFRFQDEIPTADVAFEAWGETREELFISSAAALLASMTAAPEQVTRRQGLAIRLEHEELDLLLWTFQQELLLHADSVRIEEREGAFRLQAQVSGELIDAGRHRLLVDVKAVTLHRLQVAFKDNIWKAVVVLDV